MEDILENEVDTVKAEAFQEQQQLENLVEKYEESKSVTEDDIQIANNDLGPHEGQLEEPPFEECKIVDLEQDFEEYLRQECLERDVLLILRRAEEEFDLEVIPTTNSEANNQEDQINESDALQATDDEFVPLKKRLRPSANKAKERIREAVQKLKIDDDDEGEQNIHKQNKEEEDDVELDSDGSEANITESDEEKTKSKRKTHRRSPVKISRKCPVCFEVFNGRSSWIKHISLHKSDKPLPCFVCKKEFKNIGYLKIHADRVHGDKRSSGRFIRIEWNAYDFLCYYCGKKFDTLNELKGHKLHHIKSTKFECELCHIVVKNAPSLKQHFQTVHLGFPFRGLMKRLKSKNRDLELIQMEKCKPPTVECDLCGMKFYWGWKLDEHKVRKHTKDGKPHTCQICGKGFKYNSYLTDHMRKHTKEKSYFCETCGKGFKQILYFRRHVAKLHPEVTLPRRYVYGGDTRHPFPDIDNSIFENQEDDNPITEAPSPFINQPDDFYDPLAEFEFSGFGSTFPPFMEANQAETSHEKNLSNNVPLAPIPEFVEVQPTIPCEYFQAETKPAAASAQEYSDELHGFFSPLIEEPPHLSENEEEHKVGILEDDQVPSSQEIVQSPRNEKSRIRGSRRKKFNESRTLLGDEESLNVDVKIEEGDGEWEDLTEIGNEDGNDSDYVTTKSITKRKNTESRSVKRKRNTRGSNVTGKRQRLERRKKRMRSSTGENETIKCRLQGCKFKAVDTDALAEHRLEAHGRTDEIRSYNYKCDYPSCNFRARFPDSLAAHRVAHEQMNNDGVETNVKKHPYFCTVVGCERGFSHRGRLYAHIEKDHLETPCVSITQESSTSKSKHPYHCTFPGCEKGFSHRIRLVNHMEKFHGEKTQGSSSTENLKPKYPYYCTTPGCGKGFSHRIRLVGHMEKYHNEIVQDVKELKRHKEPKTAEPKTVEQSSYPCTFPGCKKEFPRRMRMLAHLKKSHDTNSQIIPSSSPSSQLQPLKRSKDKKSCRIGDCQFRAYDRADIESHRLEVHGEAFVRAVRFRTRRAGGATSNLVWKYCKVPGCYFRTIRPEIWEFHQKSKHLNQPDALLTFKCPACEKSFGSPYYRMVHFKLKHSSIPQGLPRHQCIHCSKDFCNKVLLIAHIRRVHRDAPTFACSFCTKVYYNPDDTIIHEMRHKKQKMPFRCVVDNCKKVCVSKDGLIAHVGRDHDFPVDTRAICPTCGKEYLLANLASHERIHDTVKKHKCPVCPKDFKLANTLVRHTESCHPELFKDQEKHHACEFCGKTFYAKQSLTLHRYKHVPRKPGIPRPRKRKVEAEPGDEVVVKQRRPRKKKEPMRQLEIPTPSPTVSASQSPAPPAAHMPPPSNYDNFQQFIQQQPMEYFHPQQGQMNYRSNYPQPPPSHQSITQAQQQRLYHLQRSGFWN